MHYWPLDGDGADVAFAATRVNITLQGYAYGLPSGGVTLPNYPYITTKSFMEIGGDSGLTFAAKDGFTFATWIKIESFLNAHGTIFSLWDSSSSNFIMLYYWATTRRARVFIKNNGGSSEDFTTPDCNDSDRENDPCYFFPVAGSRWVHVALTVTDDGAWTLYRDGTTQDDWKATDLIAANPNSVDYKYAVLGQYKSTLSASHYLHGSFRDALLYDGALPADDVATVAAEGLSTWASLLPTASPSASPSVKCTAAFFLSHCPRNRTSGGFGPSASPTCTTCARELSALTCTPLCRCSGDSNYGYGGPDCTTLSNGKPYCYSIIGACEDATLTWSTLLGGWVEYSYAACE